MLTIIFLKFIYTPVVKKLSEGFETLHGYARLFQPDGIEDDIGTPHILCDVWRCCAGHPDLIGFPLARIGTPVWENPLKRSTVHGPDYSGRTCNTVAFRARTEAVFDE
jgi:hypothetical protein